jgi:hypothetical protein
MSVSKSIRKKRRQSKKRNMRGGSAPISELAVGAFNTSFVASFKAFYTGPASENSSIALRSKKLYYLLNGEIPNPQTLQDFISENYMKFFQMSCRIVAKFMETYKSTQYCALALQELNLTDGYLMHMNNEIDQVGSVILANGVKAGIVNAGLGYVIPNEKLGKYRDTRTITGMFEEDRLRPGFNSNKVAIVDLGIDTIYTETYDIYKDANKTVDSARPMALIVREEGTNEQGTIYTLHFNCHIPNPSALKRGAPYKLSILENYLGNSTEQKHIDDFEIWAVATLEVINKNAKILLEAFFTEDEIKLFSQTNNYTVIFSGDFNDGSRFLLDLITDKGISITMSDGTSVTLPSKFGLMPETCCANGNSVRTGSYIDAAGNGNPSPRITSSPPTLWLSHISKGDALPDNTLRDYVISKDIQKHDNIIDPANYDFQGDGTGSSLPNPLATTVFNTEIDLTGIFSDTEIEKLKSKDGTGNAYKTLLTYFILASDHLPAVSVSTDNQDSARTVRKNNQFDILQNAKTQGVEGADNPELGLAPKRQRSKPPDLNGGYRKKHKKRKSQRKLSRRKYKRHTKKRKY